MNRGERQLLQTGRYRLSRKPDDNNLADSACEPAAILGAD
ncbi:hypothetical protein PLANPX_5279 [Lacipirellula parvula]|uniref:Uncharacterized protein n=1 Tax=Lacipirellula parvula TaxID=2650471 RepID=A0A5K7XI56_9BACT|nr:hypothetical protein PLANPX_5279 [Lacipirellula parvula]